MVAGTLLLALLVHDGVYEFRQDKSLPFGFRMNRFTGTIAVCRGGGYAGCDVLREDQAPKPADEPDLPKNALRRTSLPDGNYHYGTGDSAKWFHVRQGYLFGDENAGLPVDSELEQDAAPAEALNNGNDDTLPLSNVVGPADDTVPVKPKIPPTK